MSPPAGGSGAVASGSGKRHTRRGTVRTSLAALLLVVGASAVRPAHVYAYATVGPEPVAGSSGLPNGRIYEQVSPANKSGNSAGKGPLVSRYYSVAATDGNAVLFGASGGVGNAVTGATNNFYVARRSGSGWDTTAAMPRWVGTTRGALFETPRWLDPAADLTRLVFVAQEAYAPPPDAHDSSNIFIADQDLSVAPLWAGRPAIEHPSGEFRTLIPVGGSSDRRTLYFAYAGTLLPEDEQRAPQTSLNGSGAWGFYEYSGSVLTEAGVLPNGSLSPFGAVPAAIAPVGQGERVANPDQLDNQISVDGSRAFFVSPDPNVSTASPFEQVGPCEQHPCTTDPPELYVRETAPDGARRTVLVSQSRLAGHVGDAAPHGPTALPSTAASRFTGEAYSFVFASPDGSRAYFASVDQLTNDAPKDSSPKTYEFNLATKELTFLPGVVGSIVTSTDDGSSLLFENTSASTPELARWSSGPDGGTITKIADLPGAPTCAARAPVEVSNVVCIGPARVSADGSVTVFETNAPIAGFNDSGGFDQVFRYDAASDELNCVSCPPTGVAPSGDAVISGIDEQGNESESGATAGVVDSRGISLDGGQVFFDTPDPLIVRDRNDARDVYEWDSGTRYLVSSGTSTQDSIFLDNSASGSDVFFATASGLVQGDTDGAYDVYDARIPHAGDNVDPTAVPCEGDVCQGPPSVPHLFDAPASAAVSEPVSLAPVVSKPSVAPLTTAQKRAAALRACRAKRTKHKRRICEAQARKRYRQSKRGGGK